MAYVKPTRPLVVIASNKVKEFRAIKPDQQRRAKNKQLLKRFRENMVKSN